MNNEEIKCPCIDCITKAICKSIIAEFKYVIYVEQRCSILEEYIGDGKDPIDRMIIRYNQVYKILEH